MPSTNISVPVPTEQFLELAEFLRTHDDPRDPVWVVSAAIDYWLDNASWKPELIAETDNRGFQWKSLFLPEGTQIRMQYKGAWHYANVEGDEIHYKDKPITPGTLANTIAGGSRNAWRDLWIKRPNDGEWILADALRESATPAGSPKDLIDDI